MAFYQRIRDLREDSDKTQGEIAEYLGTTAQYYGKYESGEREIPFQRAVKLADFYNVSLDYIAGRTNIPSVNKNDFISDEALDIAKKYILLSERNKGKLELFIDQLCENQNEYLHNLKEVK